MELEISSSKSIKYNLSDEILSCNKNEKNFSFHNNININYPFCNIISSLFTKDIKESLTFQESMNKINKKNNNENERIANNNKIQNSSLINFSIYNIKGNSIFNIKIYNKNIKYFPIFSELSTYEKYICYNPLIEKNSNFEIITNDLIDDDFYIKNYDISLDKLENIKEKYVKHNFTKKNINSIEDIFKYLFEEIKINISCINVQKSYEDILIACSKLINNINEIIEDIIGFNSINKSENNKNNHNHMFNYETFNINNLKNKKDELCLFNNDKIKKNFILNNLNSKSIEKNFLGNNSVYKLTEEENKNISFKCNNKNAKFKCPI